MGIRFHLRNFLGSVKFTISMVRKSVVFIVCLIVILSKSVLASQLLIPMDETQKNHLKAYGLSFWLLNAQQQEVEWLLNYRGGSFLISNTVNTERECKIRGISYEVISESQAEVIFKEIDDPAANMNHIKLLNAPKIAVYSPKTKQPWDDAVTMVLTYAEIPYTVIFDDEVLSGKLVEYDWLHLHHEDFTGQFGKFWSSYAAAPWYQAEVAEGESMAAKHGYGSVRELKKAVVLKIREFMLGGGFLFAMCSATDSYDIALAAAETDICEDMFDGTPADPNAQNKLNFDDCLAFKNFRLETNPYVYEFSNIDINPDPRVRQVREDDDLFTLFDFSAKWDIIPSILCQNHTKTIKGFMGQTTAYKSNLIKSDVIVMGENALLEEAKYLHGELGKGTFTFFGGHDPEDYQHLVGEPATDLNLHPNSPGYRLILNNILFPSAKKSKQKT